MKRYRPTDEVDFVIESGVDCWAVEVKAAERWEARELAGLKARQNLFGDVLGVDEADVDPPRPARRDDAD